MVTHVGRPLLAISRDVPRAGRLLPKTEKARQVLASIYHSLMVLPFHFHECACGMHACPCVFMCEGGCICVVWVDVCACVSVYVEARDDLPPCSLRQGSHSNPELIHVASLPASERALRVPSPPFKAGITSRLPSHPVFCMCSGDPNSSSHVYSTLALTIGPSSQPSLSASSLWMQCG